MIGRRDGVPFLRPHGALLYTAKALRPKDAADFANCVETLDAPSRASLRTALAIVHPGHQWLAAL
jgi:hypothetical protein